MDLIKFIIVATLTAIIFGCVFLANLEFITNYVSETVLSEYDRYDVRVIDDNDIKNIKKLNGVLPGIEIVDTSGNGTQNNISSDTASNDKQNVDPVLAPTDLLIPSTTVGSINKSSSNSNNTIPLLQKGHDPNAPISDNRLIVDNEKNRDFGIELPWDREVGFCEVLSKTDRDLYQYVKDTTTITFY